MFYVTLCMYVFADVFQVYVNKCVIQELKRVIEDSEVCRRLLGISTRTCVHNMCTCGVVNCLYRRYCINCVDYEGG